MAGGRTEHLGESISALPATQRWNRLGLKHSDALSVGTSLRKLGRVLEDRVVVFARQKIVCIQKAILAKLLA